MGCVSLWHLHLYTAPHAIGWALRVPLLGAFPLLVHVFSVEMNHHSDLLQQAVVSDVALYVFILSMAGVTESLADSSRRQGNWNLVFGLTSAAAAIFYFASLLDGVQKDASAFSFLSIVIWVSTALFALAYLFFTVPTLYRQGRLDMENARVRA